MLAQLTSMRKRMRIAVVVGSAAIASRDKPEVMRQQMTLLDARYDLSLQGVAMSRARSYLLVQKRLYVEKT